MKIRDGRSLEQLKYLIGNYKNTTLEIEKLVEGFYSLLEQHREDLNELSKVEELTRTLEQARAKNEELNREIVACNSEIKPLKERLNLKKRKIQELNRELEQCRQEQSGSESVRTPSAEGNQVYPSILNNVVRPLSIRGERGVHWGSTERRYGIDQLKNFTNGTKRIIVVDPYFYKGEYSEFGNREYIDNIKEIIDPSQIERVHIITNRKHATTTIRDEVHAIYGKKISESYTTEIHDRIWIADSHRAILVGTSLNGIGNKLAFILPLPYSDLESFKKELKNKKLLYDKNKRVRMSLATTSLEEFIDYVLIPTFIGEKLTVLNVLVLPETVSKKVGKPQSNRASPYVPIYPPDRSHFVLNKILYHFDQR